MRKPLTKIYNLAILSLLSGVAFAADETEMPSEFEAEDGEKEGPDRILVIEPKKLSIRL